LPRDVLKICGVGMVIKSASQGYNWTFSGIDEPAWAVGRVSKR
jgi:hypothetical protein